MAEQKTDDIFKEFKEHSISEFFNKNKQMLGYSSMGRALVTVVHEYVTNSLDACEDAAILPEIAIRLEKISEGRYRVTVSDNGPGIPKNFVGKALATILAGTKFHRNMQQRGQQGIGAAGCTLFAQATTGKPVHVVSSIESGKTYMCDVAIDTMHNKPVISNMQDCEGRSRGLVIEGEFSGVKYDTGEHSVFEYIKRTCISNPHAQITFMDPEGHEHVFPKSVDSQPERPKIARLHPLGLSVSDLYELAHRTTAERLSTFFVDGFARFSQDKMNQMKEMLNDINFAKRPKDLTWNESERIINAFKEMKWIAPEASHIIPIGEDRIRSALANILNPEFMNVVERKPKVFRGGFPFIVEVAIAYGGGAGRKTDDGYTGSIMRFANRVPLLFDSGNCAITESVHNIQWKRYGIDIDSQPVSVFVNVSSVHIPYSGVGKEAISQEEEIIEEIKLALMDAARSTQHFINGIAQSKMYESKYKTVMRYTGQLSESLGELSGRKREDIAEMLEKLVARHYKKAEEEAGGKAAAQ